jgi:hypothetical protein
VREFLKQQFTGMDLNTREVIKEDIIVVIPSTRTWSASSGKRRPYHKLDTGAQKGAPPSQFPNVPSQFLIGGPNLSSNRPLFACNQWARSPNGV